MFDDLINKKKLLDWKGFTTDWNLFDKIVAERWVNIEPYSIDNFKFRCEKHNCSFDYSIEPCWQCWDEVQIEL